MQAKMAIPEPITDAEKGSVDVVRLISNEFGISPQVVRSQVALGTISIDGRMWNGDKFTIPYSHLLGKILIVIGPDRRFRVNYKG